MAFPTYKSLLFSLKDNTFPDKVKLGSALRILWVLKLQTKLSSKSWIIQHLLPPYVIKSGIKVKLNCLFVPTVCKLCYIQMNLVRALCSLLLQIISLLTLPLMKLHSTCQGTHLVPWSPETLQFVLFYFSKHLMAGTSGHDMKHHVWTIERRTSVSVVYDWSRERGWSLATVWISYQGLCCCGLRGPRR